jgi:hypothetical protein
MIPGPIVATTIGIDVIIAATTDVMIEEMTTITMTVMTGLTTAKMIVVMTSVTIAEMIGAMTDVAKTTTTATMKDRYGEPERGGEWEPIKILLKGDGDSNKTNPASNTHLRLTTQVGQAHVATEVLLDLGTNKQPSEPKHTNTHSGNLHGLLLVLHRSDRWPAPVRPVDNAGQAGGYSSRTTNVPESLSDFSRPWNNNTPKTQPARKKNPTQNLTKQLETAQEQTSSTKTQRHTSQAVHLRQIPQVARTGQTGQEHRSDRCNLGSSG